MLDLHFLKENLGQLMVVGIEGESVNDAVKSLLSKIRPSGVILFSHNLSSPEQAKSLTNDLQAFAKEIAISPLLIGIDHEGGSVVRMRPPVTRFPGNMAIAATGSLEFAKHQAKAMAKELLAMGFNWNYAPCMDVNCNPQNPIIGVRSFGDDPEDVAKFGSVFIEGFQACGLIACAKHFPGHGDTEIDSHIGIPYVSRSLDSLKKIELPPFLAAVKADVATIMTAHVIFSAIDTERPATVSQKIITGLLREEMGFDGVVVSDALEMAGLASAVGVAEGVVGSINAGVDLLLACKPSMAENEVFETLQRAYNEDMLSNENLSATFERILRLKKRFLSKSSQEPLTVVGDSEHTKLENQIAESSITLLRKENEEILPINSKRVKITYAGVNRDEIRALADRLSKECIIVSEMDAAEVELILTRDLHRNIAEVTKTKELLQGRNQRTIVVSLGFPCESSLLKDAQLILTTYSHCEASLRATAEVLLGKKPIKGHFPLAQ